MSSITQQVMPAPSACERKGLQRCRLPAMESVAQLAARNSKSSAISLCASCRIMCPMARTLLPLRGCSPLQKLSSSPSPVLTKAESPSRSLSSAVMILNISPTALSRLLFSISAASPTAFITGNTVWFSSAAKSRMSPSRRSTEVRATCERLEGWPSTRRGESTCTGASPLIARLLCSTNLSSPISSSGAVASWATLEGWKYATKEVSRGGMEDAATTLLWQVKSRMRGLSHERPAEKSAESSSVSVARMICGGTKGSGTCCARRLISNSDRLVFMNIATAFMWVWKMSRPAREGSFIRRLSSKGGIFAARSGCVSITASSTRCSPDI
mmetsp:Transcript_1223/g.2785  ORF Transcript_1223/g.2785 Transcript_1223/m.2785 type:complete len:328 (-) Transcript_1223:2567-3550(-)